MASARLVAASSRRERRTTSRTRTLHPRLGQLDRRATGAATTSPPAASPRRTAVEAARPRSEASANNRCDQIQTKACSKRPVVEDRRHPDHIQGRRRFDWRAGPRATTARPSQHRRSPGKPSRHLWRREYLPRTLKASRPHLTPPTRRRRPRHPPHRSGPRPHRSSPRHVRAPLASTSGPNGLKIRKKPPTVIPEDTSRRVDTVAAVRNA